MGFSVLLLPSTILQTKPHQVKKKQTQINKNPPQTTQNPHIQQLRNLLGVHK